MHIGNKLRYYFTKKYILKIKTIKNLVGKVVQVQVEQKGKIQTAFQARIPLKKLLKK